MKLIQLKYFVALAEELHFGRAAEKMHVAQPALSQQLKKLEGELGFELLYRTNQRVELLPAGKVFLEKSRQILEQTENAVKEAQKVNEGEVGVISIGFLGSVSYSILPSILKNFKNLYPQVELILNEKTTTQQVEALESGSIDVGFVRPTTTQTYLNVQKVYQEPFVVALPVDHGLLNKEQINLQDLADEEFILFPRDLGPVFFDLIISQCQDAGFSPNIVQEAILMQTIASLVAGGLGISIVPQSVSNLNLNGVKYRALKDFDENTTIDLIWNKNNQNPIVGNFLKCVKDLFVNENA